LLHIYVCLCECFELMNYMYVSLVLPKYESQKTTSHKQLWQACVIAQRKSVGCLYTDATVSELYVTNSPILDHPVADAEWNCREIDEEPKEGRENLVALRLAGPRWLTATWNDKAA